jgi:hypothetical protein
VNLRPLVKLRRCALCAVPVPAWRLTCFKHRPFIAALALPLVALLTVLVLSAIN